MRHPRVGIVYYIISIDLYTVSANLLHVITSLDVAVRLLRVTLTAVGSPCLLEELAGCWHCVMFGGITIFVVTSLLL